MHGPPAFLAGSANGSDGREMLGGPLRGPQNLVQMEGAGVRHGMEKLLTTLNTSKRGRQTSVSAP